MVDLQGVGLTVQVDLVETVQVREPVVGRTVDAFGYSLVAEASMGGVSAVFKVGVQRVDHGRRKEDSSTACRLIRIVPLRKN